MIDWLIDIGKNVKKWLSLRLIALVVSSGQVIAQDLNDDYEFFDTPEGPPTMDNSFMGYSIAVGHFNNDSLPGVN